ncbi:MAG TPA: DUF4112 domain-containing protein [Opitutae bacterium]|nr:DUF4112 domain-containing protein [Opitutae bacterium]
MKTNDDIPDLDPYEDEWTDRIRRIDAIANSLDAQFTIPGTSIRFGWDAVVGLIPGIGDTLTALPQLYLLYEAIRLKVGWLVVLKMLFNIVIDWLIGSIPVLGDFFDVVFKSNLRNAKLVTEALRQKRTEV